MRCMNPNSTTRRLYAMGWTKEQALAVNIRDSNQETNIAKP